MCVASPGAGGGGRDNPTEPDSALPPATGPEAATPQHLLQRAGLAAGLVGEPLQGLGGRRRHLQPLEAAFEDVDGKNGVPVPRCLSLARLGAENISGLTRHERAEIFEHSIWNAQPLLLALQPEAHGAGGGGLAERAHVPDQRQGVYPHHQVQGVEEFLRPPASS